MIDDDFCFYPFTQLLLQPTGEISPCCWNQEYLVGDVKTTGLMDIWNGEKIRSLRREFLSQKPISCKTQMKHLSCHQRSHRPFWKTEELTEWVSQPPKRLDLRLNGKCNLQCIMCDVWSQPNGTYDKSDFWKIGPTLIFPFLKEVDVLGGEPFVQKDTFRLIEEVTKVNSLCQWSFVTNGQFKFTQQIVETLNKLNIRFIQLSVDSLESHAYTGIRKNGSFRKLMESIDFLIGYRKRRLFLKQEFVLNFSFCVQIKNWHQIDHFLNYCKARQVNPVIQFAYGPSSESILTLPLERQRTIVAHFESLKIHFGSSLDSVIQPIKDSISNCQPNLTEPSHEL